MPFEHAMARLGESFLSHRRVDLVGDAEANHAVMKITQVLCSLSFKGMPTETSSTKWRV